MARTRDKREAFGTVQRLPSGRYRAYYRAGDRRFNGPGSFQTKAAAQAWLASERADRYRGRWHDPNLGARTLADYAETWLANKPALALRTRDLYRDVLDRWILPPVPTTDRAPVELGRLPLTQITPTIVRTWHAQVADAARTSALARAVRRTRRPAPGHPARRWAASVGRPVAASGRLSPSLIAAWEAAGSPDPAMPARPPVATIETHPDAGKTATSQAYSLLHAILATAHQDGLINANPCHIRGAASRRPRERRVASPAEVAAIAATFPPELAAAVTLAAWSGLRRGELFGLARKHVDLTAGTVRVERQLILRSRHAPAFGKPKTDSSLRTVNLPGFVVDELRHHLAAHVPLDPDALLFVNVAGGPIDSRRLSELMDRARRTIDRPDLTWHDLRHTGATLAYTVGASVREVQNRLGHSTGRAAAIYQHAADDSDRMIADRLDALHRTTNPPADLDAARRALPAADPSR